MPDVSMEELDALMQPDMDQGHPAQDENEYEAFLKVESSFCRPCR